MVYRGGNRNAGEQHTDQRCQQQEALSPVERDPKPRLGLVGTPQVGLNHALIEQPPNFIETPSYFGPERRARSAPSPLATKGNAPGREEGVEYLEIDVA